MPYAIFGHSMGAWVAFELSQVHCCLRLPLNAQRSRGLFDDHKYQVFVLMTIGSLQGSLQTGFIALHVLMVLVCSMSRSCY